MDFEAIYNTYYKSVYAFVMSISHSTDIAEEITQETFFKAFKAYESFRGDCTVKVWLCQIAKNTFYNMRKKQASFEDIDFEILPDEQRFENALLDKSSAMLAHKSLHNLSEPYKEVFTLRVFGELSFNDIGQLFQKTEVWARVTYYRAKTKIQKEMEGLQ